jgi:uncharacterized protein (TIGR03437 family)
MQLAGNASRRTLLRCAALVLPFAAQAWAAANVVHRPYLQNMRQDQVTIVWSTKEILSGSVQFSTDQEFARTAAASQRTFLPAVTKLGFTLYQYRAVLTGLAPNTVYNYRVLAGGEDITARDGPAQFRTPAGSGPFRFLAFGDSGLGSAQQLQIALRMMEEKPSLVLHVGDIAYESGTYDEFIANYFEYYYPMMRRVPFFPVPGNHEYYTDKAAPYLAVHAPPFTPGPPEDAGRYYSYDWGDVHFVALDANLLVAPYSAAAQLAWLDQDLASANAKWKIVYWHQTPYPVEHHADDPIDIAARNQFNPILERHRVQLVLTGHEHNYVRTKPMRNNQPVTNGPATVYICSGGGGGALHPVAPAPFVEFAASLHHYLAVDVDASQITVHTIGMDGKEFDRVVLALPSIADGGVVNGASFTEELAPGELVSIFGRGLASQTWMAQGFPLPTTAGGASLTINGSAMPLIYVSPGQINAQVPLDVRGPATLIASTVSGSSQAAIALADTAPAVFPNGVLHSDGRPVTATLPAQAGETLVIYMTGLGQVNGTLAAGQPSPANPPLTVVNPVVVTLGDVTVTPFFAGLTPGFVGVYQVNLTVPRDIPSNVYPLRVATRGNTSTPTIVQVKGQTP